MEEHRKKRKKKDTGQIFIQSKNPRVGSKFTSRSNFLCEENWIKQFFDMVSFFLTLFLFSKNIDQQFVRQIRAVSTVDCSFCGLMIILYELSSSNGISNCVVL